MHLDDYHADFSFITGDTGGSTRVQSLHSECKKIRVMHELSDHINCLLHAFNLAYKTSCNDSWGDHGVNKCTAFQMIYLAILMLNTMKKHNDLELRRSTTP